MPWDAISAFEVTYGSALAKAGFHRVVTLSGEAADLNSGGTSSFLWYQKAASAQVAELAVLYDEEPAEAGWERVARNMTKGAGRDTRLAFRRVAEGSDEHPLGDVKVVVGDGAELPEGYELLERPINVTGDGSSDDSPPLRLCYRLASEEDEKWTAHSLTVGDWLDAKDGVNNWCVAQVVSISETSVTVHYKGWSSTYDEELPKESGRLAEHGSRTGGKDTGYSYRRQGLRLALSVEEVQDMAARLQAAPAMAAAERDRFLKGDLPTFLESALSSTLTNQAVIGPLQELLRAVAQFVIDALQNEAEPVAAEVVALWIKVFNGDTRCTWFYRQYGIGAGAYRLDADLCEGDEGDGETYAASASASRLLIGNVNYFGRHGGFAAVLGRLSNDLGFLEIAAAVQALAAPRFYYNADFKQRFFNDFQAAVFARLGALSDAELKALDLDALDDLLADLDNLLSSALVGFPIDETLERFKLTLAKRLLVCHSMNKQIKGVGLVNELIDMTVRKESRRYSSHSSTYYGSASGTNYGGASAAAYTNPAYGGGAGAAGGAKGKSRYQVAKWLSCDFLGEWLAEQQVTEILLGDEAALQAHNLGAMHVELLKRAGEVLKFMARQERLSAAHLALLWGASTRGDEATTMAAYSILGELCTKLALEQLLAVYERIQTLPVEAFSPATCALVQEFADNAILKAGAAGAADEALAEQHGWFGLDLLWQAMLRAGAGGAGGDERVAKRAQEALAALLCRAHVKPRVAHYLDQCFANMQQGQAVAPSMALARLLIQRQRDAAHYAHQTQQLTATLRAIDDKFHVVSLLIDDIKNGGDMESRLDFLLFVVKHFQSTVPFEQLVDLWETVYPRDPSGWMRWLLRAAPDVYRAPGSAAGSPLLFGVKVSTRLFAELLCSDERVNYAALDADGLATFERYFREINGHSHALYSAHSKTHYQVDNVDSLVGLDSLWAIVLQAEDQPVAKQAAAFLIGLHVRLGARLDKRQVWGGFVEQCMTHVTGSVGRPDDAGAQRVLERVMRLVVDFLDRVEQAGKEVLGPDKMRLPLYKRSPAPPKYLSNVVFSKTATLHEVREEAGRQFGHPPNRVRIQRYRQPPINAATHGHLTLAQQGIYTLDVYLLRDPAPDTEGHQKPRPKPGSDMDEERRYPRDVLSNNPQYFALLFQLLAERPAVVERAWHLLQLLPTNADMDAAMTSMGGALAGDAPVDWDALLDPRLPLKLLYQLQIAQGIVLRSEGSAAEMDASERWAGAFLAKGGFAHLYRILMSADLDAMCASPLTKACLASQLLLVKRFVLADAAPEAAAEGKEGDDTAGDGDSDSDDDDDDDDDQQQVLRDDLPACVDAGALVERLLHVMSHVARSVPEQQAVEAAPKIRAPKQRDRDPLAATPAPSAGATADDDDAAAAAAADQPVSTEAEVVRHANQLLVAAVVGDAAHLQTVFAFPQMADSLLFSVLTTPEAAVRAEVAGGVRRICGTAGARDFYLGVLLPALEAQALEVPHCREYFDLLVWLVRRAEALPGGAAPEALCQQLVQAVFARPVVEVSSKDEDQVLRGLFVLVRALLTGPLGQRSPSLLALASDLAEEVFANCLFAVPTAEMRAQGGVPPPKCKHPDSRAAGFELLATLAAGSADNLRLITELAAPYHTLCPSAAQRAKRRANKHVSTTLVSQRSTTGYVGMKNLGCICYMISTLQQFFMVPGFRAGILAAEDQEEDSDNSVLYQLQYMFAFLQESEKQYYDPRGFCEAFKDWEGQPTDVSVQQDASEFLTMFLQQIENSIQGTASDGVLRESFGGTYSNELIAPGGHYSERPEPFYFMSVGVQNKQNLYEALDQYVEGETVSYTWEDEEKGSKETLDTEKRVSIKSLPQTLIVHLKRFDFDFDTLQQVKINDRFEFPVELDMYKYTKEGRPAPAAGGGEAPPGAGAGAEPDPEAKTSEGEESEEDEDDVQQRPRDYYRYELQGAVVHTGTANSGHYYSFIKERGGQRWFEFNDNYVTEWDVEDLDDECFGGEGASGYSSSASGGGGGGYKKFHNAFMLIYDRKPISAEEAEAAEEGEDAPDGHPQPIRRQSSNAAMQPRIFDAIWQENTDFWERRNVYDEAHYEFMGRLAGLDGDGDGDGEGCNLDDNLPLLQLCTEFACGTLASAGEPELMERWMGELRTAYARNLDACRWLLGRLASSPENLRDQLLEEEGADSRAALVGLYAEVLRTVAEQQRPPAGYVRPPAVSGDQFADAAAAAADDSRPPEVRLVDALVSLLPVAKLHWRRFSQFFQLLAAWTRIGAEERGYLLDCGVLGIVLQLMLGERSPAPEHAATLQRATSSDSMSGDAAWSETGMVGPDFLPMLQLVAQLAPCLVVPDCAADEQPPARLAPHVEAPELEWTLLSCEAFLARVTKLAAKPDGLRAAGAVLAHVCWQSAERSQRALTTIERGIDREDAAGVAPFVKAFGLLAGIEDALATLRVEEGMPVVVAALKRNSKYILVTAKAVGQLVRLAGKRARIKEWLWANKAAWGWMESWLDTNRNTTAATYRAGYYMYKSGQTSYYSTSSSASSGSKKAVVPGPLITRVEALARREEPEFTGYDSDDEPASIIGRRISVNWGKGKWYDATVRAYSAASGRHHVVFDDGDTKDYVLAEKHNYKLLPASD